MRNVILAAIAASTLCIAAAWAAESDKTVDDLISVATTSETPAARARALDALGTMAENGLLKAKVDTVVSSLGDLLIKPSLKGDETNYLRFHAARMFQKIGPAAIGVLPKLVQAMGCDRAVDAAVGDAVAAIAKKPDAAGAGAPAQSGLPNHAPPTLDELKDDLKTDDPAIRVSAAKALEKRLEDGRHLIDELCKLMQDADDDVCRVAAGSVKAILNDYKKGAEKDPVAKAHYESWLDTYIKNLAAMLEKDGNVSRKLFAAEALAEFANDDDRARGALNSPTLKDDDVKTVVESIIKRMQEPEPKKGPTKPGSTKTASAGGPGQS